MQKYGYCVDAITSILWQYFLGMVKTINLAFWRFYWHQLHTHSINFFTNLVHGHKKKKKLRMRMLLHMCVNYGQSGPVM